MQRKRQKVMDILSRINRKLFTSKGDSEGSFLGKGQQNILKGIINNENISQDELATILNLDKTTIAKAVKRLEFHGLIVRTRSVKDQRKKELVATRKALIVEENLAKNIENSTQTFFSGITEEEIDQFKKTLGKIEENIEQQRNKVKDKKHTAMKIVKLIEAGEKVTAEKAAELLAKDLDQINEIIEKMIVKELVVERAGILSLTKSGKGHKHHAEIFKIILNSKGIGKDELVQKSGKTLNEIDSILKHFVSKDVVEFENGKFFANKGALKRHKGHKGPILLA